MLCSSSPSSHTLLSLENLSTKDSETSVTASQSKMESERRKRQDLAGSKHVKKMENSAISKHDDLLASVSRREPTQHEELNLAKTKHLEEKNSATLENDKEHDFAVLKHDKKQDSASSKQQQRDVLMSVPVSPPTPLSPLSPPSSSSQDMLPISSFSDDAHESFHSVATMTKRRERDVRDFKHPNIHAIIGPMFAGKSTLLLESCKRLRAQGARVLLLKNALDVRYDHEAVVVTHAGQKALCKSVSSLDNISNDLLKNYDVIAIDEAQFFATQLIPFCLRVVEVLSKSVIVAGLDLDSERKPFGQVLHLAGLADLVTRLYADCQICHNKALFSRRIAHSTTQVLVGGSESYIPVCRFHYQHD